MAYQCRSPFLVRFLARDEPQFIHTDPDSSQCDAECGALTADNVDLHVLCRQACILPDLTGLLLLLMLRIDRIAGSVVAPTCPPNSTYYSTIQECVDVSIASLLAFASAIQLQLPCAGGVISTAAQLESLRFCTSITGPLVITVSQPADYTSLHSIASIAGLSVLILTSKIMLVQARWRQ